jgi:Ca2+-binding RTX toxin-like protein
MSSLQSGPDIFRTRSPRRREVHAVSLKQETAVPPAELAPVRRKEAHLVERESRLTGTLLVVVGALLLALAAGEALADAELGGGGDDALRGADGGQRLAGFGGEDGIWGLAGDDGLSGGGGDDELYGGPGRDALLGGAGDDFIEAKDGQRDYVWCGPGDDVVSVDLGDRVARNCETLYPA